MRAYYLKLKQSPMLILYQNKFDLKHYKKIERKIELRSIQIIINIIIFYKKEGFKAGFIRFLEACS
jgi:hypothetical protein